MPSPESRTVPLKQSISLALEWRATWHLANREAGIAEPLAEVQALPLAVRGEEIDSAPQRHAALDPHWL